MARYGRVIFSVSCVVDLDDATMVDEAQEMVLQDVCDAVRFNECGVITETEVDPTLTEADIPDYLLECRQQRLHGDGWWADDESDESQEEESDAAV